MSLRAKNGRWEYRFQVSGQAVQEATGLAATERNRKKAELLEAAHKQAILEGRWGIRKLIVRPFKEAVTDFIKHLKVERADKEGTWKRVETSMASASTFFDNASVSMIGAAEIENYKIWRLSECCCQPVTVKHDLDNLSLFFQWAERFRLCRENPTRPVRRPSDKDAVREHILTKAEENLYFSHTRGNVHDLGRLIILQGCRPEEIASLRKRNVDLDAGMMHIRHGKQNVL